MAFIFSSSSALGSMTKAFALIPLLLGLGYTFCITCYNLFFHPLPSIHIKYGPVVRVGPNTVFYSHPDASKEIRGHRKGNRVGYLKDPHLHFGNQSNVIGANRENHIRYRRSLAYGFSHQAMLDQEPIINKWYNYTTFDIIGDLAFGEPFYCLEKSDYHPWVALIFSGVNNFSFISDLPAKGREHRRLSIGKTRRRLDSGSNRPDFMTAMTTTRGSAEELTFNELASNSSLLIAAGSETTATALSTTTYYLGAHPEIFQKLAAEAMRLFPSAPGTQPRIISPGGDTIVGRYLPAGTIVGVWQWANHHNPTHFHQAESFWNERWLGDARFENNKRDAYMPFSVGPRNCIGRNLAYAEMRLILARMVWNFVIKLAEEKGPIYVNLTKRQGI
ncbi:cytochrome P450 [Trichoderma chlorosporum]